MALTAAKLACLTDEELLRVATHEADELTSSPMELELIKRMGDLIDGRDDEIVELKARADDAEQAAQSSEDRAAAAENKYGGDHQFEPSEAVDLLDALWDAEIFSLQQLNELLQTTNQ